VALYDVEIAASDAPTGRPEAPPPRFGSASRGYFGLLAVFQVVIGATLVVSGTMLLDPSAMWLRVLATVAGLTLSYRGIGAAAHAIRNGPVDVLFGMSVTWIVLLGGAALLAPVLPLGVYADTAKTLNTPGYLRPDLFSAHPFGTNQFGLDMLARVVWGARDSLLASIVAVAVGTLIAVLLGVLAGYFAGWTDRVIGVWTNVGLAFPPLVLLLAVAVVLRRSLLGITIALTLLVIPGAIRVARANTLTFAQREYTFTARILGASRWRVLRREILPNVVAPMVGLGLLSIPLLIVAESSLSFLGLGIPAPQPTWGNMIAEGANGVFETNPHIVLVPGTVLFATVFSLNIIAQRAAHRWNPRQVKL
jgi:peptide/nickel transport system permease protein